MEVQHRDVRTGLRQLDRLRGRTRPVSGPDTTPTNLALSGTLPLPERIPPLPERIGSLPQRKGALAERIGSLLRVQRRLGGRTPVSAGMLRTTVEEVPWSSTCCCVSPTTRCCCSSRCPWHL